MAASALDARLAQERRARLQAERLLALRSEELYAANRKLAEHAHALSNRVIEQREENEALKGRSDRVAAELQVATDRAALAEQRLWDAIRAAEDGFAIFDQDARLAAANPAWLLPFDGISEVGPGASYEAILRIAADEGIVDLNGEAADDWIDRMLARWEMDAIPRTDIRLWNGMFVRLIDKRTPHGDTVCLGLDITSVIRREKALRKARDAALAASRAKSAFLANMSHEIRTPMNGVVSMAELLSDTELDTDQRLYADTIRRSGEALLEMIEDVLDYSKIEAGRLEIRARDLDLTTIILEVFRLLRPELEGRDLSYRLDLDIDRPNGLIGDGGRIRQILFNLVGNAVKFTETGHVALRVRGGGGDDAGVPIVVSVEDTGIGIDPQLQEHVFGEFNQAEDQHNRSHDGTGLGLAITRRLVQLMGGTMKLVSLPGEGSTFSFDILLGRSGVKEEPAARLPARRRQVVLYGEILSEPARRLIERLHQIGAHVRAGSRVEPGMAPALGATVVLLDRKETVEHTIKRLSATGYDGPIWQLEELGASDLDGVRILPENATGETLRDLLLSAEARHLPDSGASPRNAARQGPTRLSLLAAEDNRTNQLVFRTMLKSLDLDLRLVENGAELVEAYREAQPDLVFTDISMPVMDGVEATTLIRSFETECGRPRVPIVAMTAHSGEDDRDRFLAAGMDDYLTKPLKKADLLARISAFAPMASGRNP